jgi:hypothetical protein
MGKSLMASQTGTHIVFAAGTGVLCYVDLVAHLALANLGVLPEEDTVDVNSFKLVLYVSFQSRQDSVGLDLFEALDAYCKRQKLRNFELYVRLSKEKQNSARWDKQFIEQ